MATDLFSLFILEIIGIICLFGFISWLMIFVNNNLSQLGIYHIRKTKNNCNGENFPIKLIKVFSTYVSLFPLVYFSIYITLKFLPFSDATIGYQGIIKGAPLFTIVFLILMRVLMNPTYTNVDNFLKILRRRQNFELVKKNTEIFKERILTFFSSYISLTLIVFILYALVEYYIAVYNPSNIPGIIESIWPASSIPDKDTISALILTYLSLFVLFIIGIEIMLWINIPIIQTDWEIARREKPLTIDIFKTFGLSKRDLFIYHFHQKVSLISQMLSKTIIFLKFKLRHN